jgi:hypothetical protein
LLLTEYPLSFTAIYRSVPVPGCYCTTVVLDLARTFALLRARVCFHCCIYRCTTISLDSPPPYPVLYSPSQHSAKHFFAEIWDTLKNLTTFYLIIYVIGIQGFTNFTSNANIQLQYYVIKLTNFQAGIDTITTYSALVLAIYLFQRYMINRDWHITQYASVLIAAGLGLVWIAPYYNSGGTQDPWFTIFIDLDTVRQSPHCLIQDSVCYDIVTFCSARCSAAVISLVKTSVCCLSTAALFAAKRELYYLCYRRERYSA